MATLRKIKLSPLRVSSKEKFLLKLRKSILNEESAEIFEEVLVANFYSENRLAGPGFDMRLNAANATFNPGVETILTHKSDFTKKNMLHDYWIAYVESLSELFDLTDTALLEPFGFFDPTYSSPVYSENLFDSDILKEMSASENISSGQPIMDAKKIFDLPESTYQYLNKNSDEVKILRDTANELLPAALKIPIDLIPTSIDNLGAAQEIIDAMASENPPKNLATLIVNKLSDSVIIPMINRYPAIINDPVFFSSYTTALSFGMSYAVLSIIGTLLGSGDINRQIAELVFEIV